MRLCQSHVMWTNQWAGMFGSMLMLVYSRVMLFGQTNGLVCVCVYADVGLWQTNVMCTIQWPYDVCWWFLFVCGPSSMLESCYVNKPITWCVFMSIRTLVYGRVHVMWTIQWPGVCLCLQGRSSMTESWYVDEPMSWCVFMSMWMLVNGRLMLCGQFNDLVSVCVCVDVGLLQCLITMSISLYGQSNVLVWVCLCGRWSIAEYYYVDNPMTLCIFLSMRMLAYDRVT